MVIIIAEFSRSHANRLVNAAMIMTIDYTKNILKDIAATDTSLHFDSRLVSMEALLQNEEPELLQWATSADGKRFFQLNKTLGRLCDFLDSSQYTFIMKSMDMPLTEAELEIRLDAIKANPNVRVRSTVLTIVQAMFRELKTGETRFGIATRCQTLLKDFQGIPKGLAAKVMAVAGETAPVPATPPVTSVSSAPSTHKGMNPLKRRKLGN
jgi:hypothetical protein